MPLHTRHPQSLHKPSSCTNFTLSSQTILTAVRAGSLQLCLTLCDSVDCGRPGFSVKERVFSRQESWTVLATTDCYVIATLSGKQTHSEGQCRQWSAVYYTGGPKAECPLSQGSRLAFVKIFYTPCVRVQTHHPKSLEAYKGRVNTITITPSFTCYVFQTVNQQAAVTFQPVNNR